MAQIPGKDQLLLMKREASEELQVGQTKSELPLCNQRLHWDREPPVNGSLKGEHNLEMEDVSLPC